MLRETEHWLRDDPQVARLREQGVWTEFSDRIVRYGPVLYMSSAEHSAQVPKQLLPRLERDFKRGKVNVLHCSTTMEMGVDIGGLSGVVMNNAPPAPANYGQRAGRAGRRGESRAVVLTMCPSTPHAQAVFQKPTWPFVTEVRPPEVALTSERIVQRHLHSLLLAEFLGDRQMADSHVMQCKSFFVPTASTDPEPRSLCDELAAWLDELVETSGAWKAAEALVHGTALEGQVDARLRLAQDDLRSVQEAWRAERDAQLQELERLGGSLDSSWDQAQPAERSVRIAIRRLDEDFLLRLLAGRGFLPAYGFPLSVVPLVTLNSEELAHFRTRMHNQGDAVAEDRPDPSLGYPTRGLERALQEYAPGTRVLINGTVREPRGVTLNWLAPVGSSETSEPQSLRHFSRCKECGEMFDSISRFEHCPGCGSENVQQLRYLEPSGFAVDIRDQPHNDSKQRTFPSPSSSRVSASGAPWQPLPSARMGRYRHSHEGRLFSYVFGAHEKGYAVCRHCGRVESMTHEDQIPASFTAHRRLRGGRRGNDTDGVCPGGAGGFGVWPRLGFGGARQTDVFELELRDVQSGGPLGGTDAKIVSATLAVALREGLARRLGIDPRELGFSTRSVKRDGASHWVIAVYDRADGGAGYAGKAVDDIRRLLEEARAVLRCPNDCDRICHGCLLSFDTDRMAHELDRRRGLSVLTDGFLNTLALPSELRAFGEQTAFEPHTLRTALALFIQKHGGADVIRAHWGAQVEDWEFRDWPLRPLLLAQAAQGARVEIVVPRSVLDSMPWDEANPLAEELRASSFVLMGVDGLPRLAAPAHLCLEARAGHHVRAWAISDPQGLSPGPAWDSADARNDGDGSASIRVVGSSWAALQGAEMNYAELRKEPPARSQVHRVQLGPGTTLAQFGELFWRQLWSANGAGAPVHAAARLANVRYSDRYLCSPLTARALHGLLAGLQVYGFDRSTKLDVVTVKPTPGKDHDFIYSSFYGGGAQRQVLEGLLGKLSDNVSVNVRERARDLQHARLLELAWAGGPRLLLGFDQGLGFLESKRRERFSLMEPAAAQVSALLACRVELVETDTWVWTRLL